MVEIEEASASTAVNIEMYDNIEEQEDTEMYDNIEEQEDTEMYDFEEQEEGEKGEGEGEGEIESGEYEFIFEGDMNPLDFTENDAFGVQPYQKFEEYEALAEKKRRALSNRPSDESTNKQRKEDIYVTEFEKIQKEMMPRKRRKSKKKGRRKGSKNKLGPEVTRKLGEANILYAKCQYEEAIRLLNEVILLAPNLSEAYHTCGLVYEGTGNTKRAMNFYMIAALLAPKEHQSLWKRLVSFSKQQGNIGQSIYCLSRAIRADPEDISLRFERASLYIELGDYKKAAESYDHIVGLQPENVEACKMAAKMHQKCGQVAHSASTVEDYLKNHPNCTEWSLVDLLAAIFMENNTHSKALEYIEHARSVYFNGEQPPAYLTAKAGICHVHLGNIGEAEILFRDLRMNHGEENANLIIEVANSFMNLGHHNSALKYYFLLEGINGLDNGFLHLKIAQCYVYLKQTPLAIKYLYKVLHELEDNIEARLTLASLLLEEEKGDEAIVLLCPPNHIVSKGNANSVPKPWWSNGKVKMQLAKIYLSKGMLEDFVEAILLSVSETLDIEISNAKVRRSKKTPTSVLRERVEALGNHHTGNVYRFPLPVQPYVRTLAKRAEKSLQKQAALKEEKKAAVLAAGLDWQSDDSDEESQQRAPRVPPLPNLLKDDEHYQLILNLCKALASLRRYLEALVIIDDSLKLAGSSLSNERKEELLAFKAQLALTTNDPLSAYDYARHNVERSPHSIAAWNRYYQVISRLENKLSKHSKFLLRMCKHAECPSPMLINGHQLTKISQHQAAAREYLEAYKLQPQSPLINLCVGTALIGLALGFRLQNKHQCLAQGFAFLYKNLLLCDNSQESLYNIARACQHVGLVSLAVSYYEKVLTMHPKGYPIPNLGGTQNTTGSRCCDLRREAAYNLHLIYKKSGALDLARQVLRNNCTL